MGVWGDIKFDLELLFFMEDLYLFRVHANTEIMNRFQKLFREIGALILQFYIFILFLKAKVK